MSASIETVEIWLKTLEPIVENRTGGLNNDEVTRLYCDLLTLEKQLIERKSLQPGTAYDGRTTTMLRQCNLFSLAAEKRVLSPVARQELFNLVQNFLSLKRMLLETLCGERK